jgi:hypothetical protein
MSVEEYKHSEGKNTRLKSGLLTNSVENQHCVSNLMIPPINAVHFMPTKCKLSKQGKSFNQHSCLKGKHHCDKAVSKELCTKMSIYYEKTRHVQYDMSKCKELLGNRAVFSCDEVKSTHKEPLAIKL